VRDTRGVAESLVDVFEAAHRAALEAGARGDIAAQFAGLAPDVEWRVLSTLPEARVLRGRDEAIRFWRELLEIQEWRVEPLEYIDAGSGRVLVHLRGTATGHITGITTTNEFYSVAEVGADGLVHRMAEYEEREQALAAARGR
jgi:ketosteroid isomerase-like protein